MYSMLQAKIVDKWVFLLFFNQGQEGIPQVGKFVGGLFTPD